jgi:hypothetical protein
MRFCLLLIGLLLSYPSHALQITNFKSGLACTHIQLTTDGTGWICQPAVDVLVTDQGNCVFNGAEKRCTWVGFEFDYRNADKGEKLKCIGQTSLPTENGNPNSLIASNATSQSYTIELEPGSGHFFNPQYFVFAGREPESSVLVATTRCSSNGKTVFEYTFKVHYPTVPRG